MRGYCRAVRSALTDDGHPPLAASGLTLHARRSAISMSLERSAKRGCYPSPLAGCRRSSTEAGPRPPRCGPRCVSRIAGSTTQPTSSPMRNNALGRLSSGAWAASWGR
jgi:hypothetical protein